MRRALGAVLALGLGVALGWTLRGQGEGANPVQEDPRPGLEPGLEPVTGGPTGQDDLARSGAGGEGGTRDEAGSERPEPGSSVAVPSARFTEALLDHHAREFVAGWRSERALPPTPADESQGLEAFREGVLALSFQLGARLAQEQNERERVATAHDAGDALELLRCAAEGLWQPTPAALEEGALETWFRPEVAGSAVDGLEFLGDREARLEDGAVLRFPRGVYTLDGRRLRGADGRALPADVTLVGAGKDLTLLRLGDLGADGSLERLSFRDLTLDCENDGLFDHRSRASSISLERVRVVRFDAGHGGCYVFFFREGVLVRARDCEFVGGYGTRPGMGDLARGEPLLASFVDCRFRLLGMHLPQRLGSTSAVRFERCHFELEHVDPLSWNAENLSLTGCTSAPLPLGVDRESVRLELKDLFPGA